MRLSLSRQRFKLTMRALGFSFAGLFGLIAVAALATPAMALPFEDPASGFKIDPPAPFFVLPATTKSYDFAAVINSSTGAPAKGAGDSYLCQVGFKAQPDSAGLSQEEINLQVAAPGWLDNAAEALSASFNVTGKATFMLEGATGIELVGLPKDTNAAGIFVSIIDTPKGRTTLNCATPADGLDGALNQFRLIRASITLPGTLVTR
jgi:hypothetical protein